MIASIATQNNQQGQQQLAERSELRQPFISQQKAFASGDRKAIMGAASPAFKNISDSFQANQSNIRNNLTGPERDFALAESGRDRTNSIYAFLNQLYQSAPQNLAALGTENANVGLSQIGTGLNAFGTSADITGNMIQQENARRAAMLQFLGGLAGSAGSLAGAKWGKK